MSGRMPDTPRLHPLTGATRYRAPWWLPGGHLQTLYPALLLRPAAPPYRRECWDTPDADFVEVDWLDGSEGAPLVVLFHGLEGGSRSPYAANLMRHLAAAGWRGVVPHFRGCGGRLNRLPRAYHSGDATEIGWMLRQAASRSGADTVYAVGVSLGGNALLKWLAQAGAGADVLVRRAAAVSAPLDLRRAGDGLAVGLNRIYTRHFLRSMKRKSLAKLALFPNLYDRDALRRARTLRAFDDLVTAPLHGFRDADDYWSRASALPDLHAIRVPTLIVHARNDPFLPGEYLSWDAHAAPCVTLEITEGGGHAGFVSGPFPGRLDWLPQRLLRFFGAGASCAEAVASGPASRVTG
ncbi:MAG TPA: hydrolase [Burkholderiales bacterium]|nr:hydrolase [Burkholderiales bacterium]